jgi:hypothetical protein
MTCAVTETGSAINNETMTGFRICISAEMRLRYFAKKFARLLYVVSDGWKDLGLYANSLAALERETRQSPQPNGRFEKGAKEGQVVASMTSERQIKYSSPKTWIRLNEFPEILTQV